MPIFSMTAFANHHTELLDSSLSCSLRSVNHRYLELTLKLPEILQPLEPALREQIRRRLNRGKIDLHLKWDNHQPGLPRLNRAFAEQLLKLCNEIDAMARHSAPVDALQLLSIPGVLEPTTLAGSAGENSVWEEPVRQLVETTLDSLIAQRQHEGQAVFLIMEERLSQLQQHLQAVTARLPELMQQMQEKLEFRLQEAAKTSTMDASRLHQEIVLWLQRLDVTEELDRIQIHIDAIRTTLTQGGAIGRKTDFLIQELHREANTLTAKSLSAVCTHQFVDIKLLVEQLREQIQNIE